MRKIQREFRDSINSMEFDGKRVPVIKVFGQYIAFPIGNPRQFWRAARMIAKIHNFSNKAIETSRKLEAQLLKIQELHSQLFRG